MTRQQTETVDPRGVPNDRDGARAARQRWEFCPGLRAGGLFWPRAGGTALPEEPARQAARAFAALSQFEDRFDLHRRVPRQRAHSDGAASADAVLVAPDFLPQLAAAVDHFGMVREVSRRVDHAQRLHHALDAVEAAE